MKARKKGSFEVLVFRACRHILSGGTLFITGVSALSAETVTNTDDDGTGSLRWAIGEVSSSGTIDFAGDLSGKTIVLQSRIRVTAPKNLTVDASALPYGITISGDAGVTGVASDNVRAFMVAPGATLNLVGLRIADCRSPDGSPGSSGGDGGAIFNEGVLYLSNCTLADNTSGDGSPGTLLGVNGGRGGHGGAVWSDGTLLVTGSTFVGNTTGNGADGTTGLAGATGGTGGAGGSGGAIYSDAGTLEIYHSTFTGNRTGNGGTGGDGGFGFPAGDGGPGGSTGKGGALASASGIFWVIHGTVVDNSTGWPGLGGSAGAGVGGSNGMTGGRGIGGGIYRDGGAFDLENTIVAGNTATGSGRDIYGEVTPDGVNFVGDGTNVTGLRSGVDLFGDVTNPRDPLLYDLGCYGGPTEVMHPKPGSQVIDPPGGATGSIFTDQRGFARVVDGNWPPNSVATVDIGAVEAGLLTMVTTPDDPTGAGTSLREAIAASPVPGQRIVFDSTVFNGESEDTIVLDGTEITLPSGAWIFIDASYLGPPVTVSGNDSSRLLHLNSASAAVRNLNFREGQTSGDGGALRVYDGSLLLMDCLVRECDAPSGVGGGIACGGHGNEMLTCVDCRLWFNDALSGGAIHNQGRLVLDGCAFSVNEALDSTPMTGGGAICITSDGMAVLTDCSFNSNFATDSGGAVLNGSSASCMMSGCSLWFINTAHNRQGGAVMSSGALTMINCTVTESIAETGGGGIAVSGSAVFKNCTIADNETDPDPAGQGGGLHIDPAASVTLENTIVAGNEAGTYNDISGPVSPAGVNLVGDPAGTTGLRGGIDITGVDPLLLPSGDYGGFGESMLPRPDSPAIDAALPDPMVTVDQRGFARPFDGDGDSTPLPDIGAVELTLRGDYAHFWNLDWDGDGNPFGVEHALGTDHATSDRSAAENLKPPEFHSGECDLFFGLNDAAKPHTIWILERSLDLAPGSFEEIYRYSGPDGTETFDPDFDSLLGVDSIIVTDLHPPDPCAFYRFGAVFVPLSP